MKNRTKAGATRRQIIQGAGGIAAAATFGLPGAVHAQAKGKVVVGTWGGDYARLLNKNVEVPYLIPAGWEVVQDQAGDPQRRSKMLAEQRLPRGTSDVQGLSALNMFQMHDAGVIDPIDYGKLKNAGKPLGPAFISGARMIMLVAMPFYVGLSLVAEPLVLTFSENEAVTLLLEVFMNTATKERLSLFDCSKAGRTTLSYTGWQ